MVAEAPPPQPVIRKPREARHKTAIQRLIVAFKTHLRATFFETAAVLQVK